MPFPIYYETNSTILGLLPHTDYWMAPPITLLDKYGLVPMAGNIYEGGFSTIASVGSIVFRESSVADEPPAEQKSFSFSQYALEKYLSRATARQVSHHKKDFIRRIQDAAKDGPGCLFSNINILLMEFARAKQAGIAAQELLEEKAQQELFKNIEGTLQLYYLCLLIGTDINPDPDITKGLEDNDEIAIFNAIGDHLSFKVLLKKIIKSEIDLKSIYENRPKGGLGKVVELLHLPENLSLSDSKTIPAEIFTIRHPNYKKQNHKNADYISSVFQGISDCFLYDLARQDIAKKIMEEFHAVAQKNIELLAKKMALLRDFFSEQPQKTRYVKNDFLQKPFPILVIADEKEGKSFSQIDPFSATYHATAPLKWGKDIQTIATDTPANQKKLEAYVAEHKLAVTVITFADLQAIKNETQTLAEARQLRQKTLKAQEERLQQDLDVYIKRIESHKTSTGNINFSWGFWWDPATRAINRAANYHLAKQLYQEFKRGEGDVTFAKVAEKRTAIMSKFSLKLREGPNFADRGINSRELNKILRGPRR